MPPSTPVKKGAAPLNISVDTNTSGTPSKVAVLGSGTVNKLDTPASLLRRNLKRKVSQHPANVSTRNNILVTNKPKALKCYG